MWKFVILLLVSSISHAGTLGLHLQSVHNKTGFNNDNPGIYFRLDNGFTAGTYYNSEYRQSTYVGKTFAYRYFEVSYLAINGYQGRILPVAIPSRRLGDHGRISLILNPLGASALHFSIEKNF